MDLVITPGQLARRSEFYYQLGQLTAAGLGLVPALQTLERNPPAPSYRQPIHQMLGELTHGFTLSESAQRLGRWLPALDLALLHAGEQSGRLDSCFAKLAAYYSERAQLGRQLLADLAYPAFLFHFAVFIIPFPSFFLSGNWIRYLCETFGVLLPLYAVVGLTMYAAQSRHGEGWRSLVESLLRRIPVLGSARHSLALARLAGALEALLSAGVGIIEGWELAANASASPALRRAVFAWHPNFKAGKTPAEMVNASPRFPELFANQYATGEISGKLDDTLRHLHDFYQEEGSRKLRAFGRWVPRGIYLGIALGIAVYVVKMGMAYFKMVGDAAGW